MIILNKSILLLKFEKIMEELVLNIKDKAYLTNYQYKSELLSKILDYFNCKKISLKVNKYVDSYTKDILIIGKEIQFEYLVNTLNSDVSKTRIMSLEVLYLLLNNNKENQYLLIRELSIMPIGSIICLNWFPKALLKICDGKIPLKFINDIQIKSSSNNNNHNMGVSQIQNDNNTFWMWPPNYKVYNDSCFPDPEVYLFGIYLVDNFNEQVEESLFKTFNKEEIDYDYIINRLEDNLVNKKRISTSKNIKELKLDDEKKKKK